MRFFPGFGFFAGISLSLSSCQQILPSGTHSAIPGPVSGNGAAQSVVENNRYIISDGPESSKNWIDCQTGTITTEQIRQENSGALTISPVQRDFLVETCAQKNIPTPLDGPQRNQLGKATIREGRFIVTSAPSNTTSWVDCQTGTVTTQKLTSHNVAITSAMTDRDIISELCAQHKVPTPISKYEIAKPKYPTMTLTPWQPRKP